MACTSYTPFPMGNRIITVVYLALMIAAGYEVFRRVNAGATQAALFPAAIALFCIVRIYLIYRNEQRREANEKRGK